MHESSADQLHRGRSAGLIQAVFSASLPRAALPSQKRFAIGLVSRSRSSRTAAILRPRGLVGLSNSGTKEEGDPSFSPL